MKERDGETRRERGLWETLVDGHYDHSCAFFKQAGMSWYHITFAVYSHIVNHFVVEGKQEESEGKKKGGCCGAEVRP